MQPIVNGLEQEYRDRVVFERVDVNTESGRLRFQAYRLRGHPGFVLVDTQGEVLWSFTGPLDSERFRLRLEALLPPPEEAPPE